MTTSASYCPICGNANPPDAQFCARCGSRVGAVQPTTLVGVALQDRYLVEKQLGRGGMGVVYQATDQRLSRQVAVKLLAAELVAHPSARRRMTQEANALARIDHENVVRVFDVFDHGAQLAMVLELVTGGDLGQFVVAGGCGERRALALVDALLAGLVAIHAEGLVHRDIKPENILVSARGVCKVADLGVAHDPIAREKTKHGARFGTADYMSPEQAQGLAVDQRSDLYAVGLILFELLTGLRPHGGNSEVEVLAARVQVDADLAPLQGKCSPDIARVVRRALARAPEQRFASASEMRTVVQSGGQPVEVAAPKSVPAVASQPVPEVAAAARSSATGPAQKPAAVALPNKLEPLALWLIAAVAVAVVITVGVLILGRTAKDEAARPVDEASAGTAPATPPRAPAVGPSGGPESAVPTAAVFAPSALTCAWSISAKSRWLQVGEVIASDFIGRSHAYTSFRGTNNGTIGSKLEFKGARDFEVTATGELLTVKSWSPSPDLEWVAAFWHDGNAATATLTRLHGSENATRVLQMAPALHSDLRDGHFLWMHVDSEASTSECVLQLGADLGLTNSRGKSKPEIAAKFALPHTGSGGWPQRVGGDWQVVREF